MAAPARVEPMNAVSRHAKVKATLKFADQRFVSGEHVAGKMEMECKTDNGLAIGNIVVELLAFEELLSRDHSAAQTFLHSRRVFQGPGLPPSNAVQPYPSPGDPLLPKDYYPARRGATTFLFRIHLPDTSPPSINFGSGVARIRYEVRASVGVIWKGEKQLVLVKSEVNVIERYDPRSPLTRPDAVAISENGRVWVKGEIVGDGVFAGEPACVALTVKNHSTKKNTGLTVTFNRQLVLPNVPQDHPLQMLDTLATVPFRGPEFVIQPGVEGVAHLIFDVPDAARTVKAQQRYGGEDDNRLSPNLFSIRCTVNVKMNMGFGNKDIELELPVAVYHPSVLDMTTELARAVSPAPTHFDLPSDQYRRPISPMPYGNMSPAPQDFPHAWSPPLPIPFVDNGRVYLPSASPMAFQQPYLHTPHQPAQIQPFLVPPYISPARPSSAEPIASVPVYSRHPGLPTSSVHQPLPAMAGGSPQTTQREEGKGDRASRISHHLRVSSRARSVSPQSHRYTMYNVAPPQDVFTTPPQPILIPHHAHPVFPLSHSPDTPPLLFTAQLSPQSAGSVVSPRPMHSPKQTVTVDPFTNATFAKCEDVDVLERLAAETVRANADMSRSMPDLFPVVDKTLPRPPVPSTKPRRIGDRPRANSLFPSLSTDERDLTPPTPTLAAISSPKASRAGLGGMGGLDALEAKLLAEVGTHKPLQEKRTDVRTIMPITIPRPNAVPDPVIDSAISSLSLPGIGGEEGTLRLEPGSFSERSYKAQKEDSRQLSSTEQPPVKGRSRKKSTPKPRVAEEVREKEQYRLRKAAQGRVTAWLGSIDPDAPPQTATPPTQSPVPTKLEIEAEHEVVEKLADAATHPSTKHNRPPSTTDATQDPVKAPSAPAERRDDKPDPRSSGFIPLGTLRKLQLQAMAGGKVALPSRAKGKGLADIFPSQSRPDSEGRYDVRSARGGKGGIVTAVASIWTSQTNGESSSKPESPLGHRRPSSIHPMVNPSPLNNGSGVPPMFAKAVSQPVRPAPPLKHSTSTSPSTPTPTRHSPSAELAARRANMAKSSSVPAVVSSSLAAPMLSSTASLAKPRPTMDKMRFKSKLPPTISEMSSPQDAKPVVSSKPQNELAFGKARLRELIQKYQG
ncbi:hypothetical protein BC835DRAFT_1414282 [Cytidiella melzeri]|nr:hypothetical protein BC835DRAFT_1414282 [Cytidiella melzeri]